MLYKHIFSVHCAFTYPQARLRIFHPQRSCTALGYMVDSREVFVTPQKKRPPEEREVLTTNTWWVFNCAFPREELHAYPFHSQQRNTGSHNIFELLHGLGSQRAWLIVGPFHLSVRHGLVVHIPQIPRRKHAFGNPTPAVWKQQFNSGLIHQCLSYSGTNQNLQTCYSPCDWHHMLHPEPRHWAQEALGHPWSSQ